MRKRLQIALMASAVIATLLSLTKPYVQAEAGSSDNSGSINATTDDGGRKIYTNDALAAPPAAAANKRKHAPGAARSSLVYWSGTEHRWKPVPSAHVRAARSAAQEVNQYLGRAPGTGFGRQTLAPNPVTGKAFSPRDIDAAIDQAAERHNVDPNLVRALIKVESNFNPNAVSRKGAMGLMQLMPQTARQLNVINPFDPEQNVDAGVRHLKQLMESFGGDVRLSLAAYNAGAGAVTRSAGIPHYAETRNYVRRITGLYGGGVDARYRILSNPEREPIHVQRDAKGVLYISNTD
jgi:soluble lytic murein transglycosylase-like protein